MTSDSEVETLRILRQEPSALATLAAAALSHAIPSADAFRARLDADVLRARLNAISDSRRAYIRGLLARIDHMEQLLAIPVAPQQVFIVIPGPGQVVAPQVAIPQVVIPQVAAPVQAPVLGRRRRVYQAQERPLRSNKGARVNPVQVLDPSIDWCQ